MGSKMSRNRAESDLSIDNENLPSKPYRFLDTSEMPSSDVPSMIKSFLKPEQDQLKLPSSADGRVSSLGCKKGEMYIDIISHFGRSLIYMFAVSRSDWCPDFSDSADKLIFLIDLDSGEMHKVIIDTCINGECGVFVTSRNKTIAVMVYNEIGRGHLQLRQSDDTLHLFHPLCRPSIFHSDPPELIEGNVYKYITCCSISPNGKWLVLAGFSYFWRLLESRSFLEVCAINNLDKKKLLALNNTEFPDNILTVVSLEFSPDSNFLAAGNFGDMKSKVFLISTKPWQVILHVGENAKPRSCVWGIFNPLSTHHELITLTKQGCLGKWDTSPLHSKANQLDSVDQMNIMDGSTHISYVTWCPAFSRDGKMLAIPLSDGNVVILDPNLFEMLWTIPCPQLPCPQLPCPQLPCPQLPGPHRTSAILLEPNKATSVHFSNSCEYLTIGYSEDFVCVWLLPRMHFTLKHFCRTKIISICPPSLVHKLPIPAMLKQYLLYQL